MFASGCLVTESPDFEPKQAPPSLFSHEQTPTTEVMLIFQEASGYPLTEFFARVLSEETNEPLKGVLLLDYGNGKSESGPWLYAATPFDVNAGRLSQGPRLLEPRPKFPFQEASSTTVVKTGCHTITLATSHEFQGELGQFYCPEDPRDFATLTWFITLCTPEGDCLLDDCPVNLGQEHEYCLQDFDQGAL